MATTLFRRILVPNDFSSPARAALKAAADLARAHDGKLIVVHAIAPVYPVTDFPVGEASAWTPPAELVASARERLEKEVARVQANGKPAATIICEIGDPSQRILAAAKRADSIVMATEGRTGLAHLLIGSVAEKIVRHSPIPVLTLRARRRRS